MLSSFYYYHQQKFIKQRQIYFTGIDFSSAFDISSRSVLLNVIGEFLEEDEARVIRYLLSSNIVKPKMNRAGIETLFRSNVGIPQIDSICPFYFIYIQRKHLEI